MVLVVLLALIAQSREVVVVESGFEQLAADVARELQLGGHVVTRAMAANTDDIVSEAVALARSRNATGVITLAQTAGGVSIVAWGEHGTITKLRRRDVALGLADDRRVAALRAVELLRAVLLDISLAEAARPEPVQLVEIPPNVAPAASAAAKAQTLVFSPESDHAPTVRTNAWRLGIGIGGTRFGDDQLVPTASVGFARVLCRHWLAEASVHGSVVPMSQTEPNALVDIRSGGVLVGIGPLWRQDPWELSVLASAGITAFVIEGDAAPPLTASTTTVGRPTVTASVRASYWLDERLWTRVGLDGGWLRPVDIFLGTRRAAEIGSLVLTGGVSLGVAWDGAR